MHNCLSSHEGGEPVHIHHLVQPVTRSQMEHYGAHGPALQVKMFEAGEYPDAEDIDRDRRSRSGGLRGDLIRIGLRDPRTCDP